MGTDGLTARPPELRLPGFIWIAAGAFSVLDQGVRRVGFVGLIRITAGTFTPVLNQDVRRVGFIALVQLTAGADTRYWSMVGGAGTPVDGIASAASATTAHQRRWPCSTRCALPSDVWISRSTTRRSPGAGLPSAVANSLGVTVSMPPGSTGG